MNIDLYMEFINPKTIQDYRKRLFVIWKKDPCTIKTLCRRTGLSNPTIKRFLIEGKDITAPCLIKIAKYVQENE